MITNTIIFFIVLSALIFFHELGHYAAARFFGVGVEKFSLGFGPRLFGYKNGITDYCVSAIPLGGYVKMVGDDPTSDLDRSLLSCSFSHKHAFKKIVIVLAGPIFNVLFAISILFIVFSSSGILILEPIVGKVVAEMPAIKAGIKPGDTIVSINENRVTDWNDIIRELSNNSQGSAVKVQFKRDDVYSTVLVKPVAVDSKNLSGYKANRYAIGIFPSGETRFKEITYFVAFRESFIKTYEIVVLTISGIVNLLKGTISIKTMGGPIMIAEMTGQYAHDGITSLAFFVALLSVNLAVLNCLPIPVLDGGHFVFFIVEAIRGKEVNLKLREIAYKVGMMVLLLIMVFVFYNDIIRLFSR